MKTLYLLLDGLTILFPFLLSFDKKVAYYKSWKYIFYAILIIGIPFVIWDMLFTKWEIWGFNSTYLTGLNIGNLPIEEVLFFVVVPYACVFIHACVKAYFPTAKLTKFNNVFYLVFAAFNLTMLVVGFGNYYTTTASVIALLVILLLKKSSLNITYIPISFLIALIPFFIVNGVLTGSGIDAAIVWYDDTQNLAVRMFTIPIEDSVYGWTLIAMNIYVVEYFLQKKKSA